MSSSWKGSPGRQHGGFAATSRKRRTTWPCSQRRQRVTGIGLVPLAGWLPSPALAEPPLQLQPTNPFLPDLPPQDLAATNTTQGGTDAKAGVLGLWAAGTPVVGVCPLIDMEQVFSVAGAPTPSSGPGGPHSVPVRCPGDICQALVEMGFTGIVGRRVGGGQVCAWRHSQISPGGAGCR